MSQATDTVRANARVVAVTGAILGTAATLVPYGVSFNPNRVVEGEPVSLLAGLGTWGWVLLGIWLMAGALALSPLSFRARGIAVTLLGGAAPVVMLGGAGAAATQYTASTSDITRTSLLWASAVAAFAAYVVIFAATAWLERGAFRALLTYLPVIGIAALMASGRLADLAVAREYANNAEDFAFELRLHLFYVAGAVSIGLVAGLALGLLAVRRRALEPAVFGTLNVLQVFPTLAFVGLMNPILSGLSDRIPLLQQLGVRGVGWAPVIIVLSAYAVYPIARNTYTALSSLDPDVLDAASGVGMGRSRRLARDRVPARAADHRRRAASRARADDCGRDRRRSRGRRRAGRVRLPRRERDGDRPHLARRAADHGACALLRPRRARHPARDPALGGHGVIEITGLTKRYEDFTAVDSVDLTVAEGEFAVLLGPSGSGKTTMLRMVNRMVEPTSGTVFVNGRDTASMKVEELRRSMGYVIQSTGLFPNMTIRKNVATVPRLLGWDRKRTDARVDELLDLVGLDPDVYGPKRPSQLSGGEAQRVGVARALAADPPLLLMDEPFGAVDPLARERLQQEMKRLQEKLRKTILFVTHDIEEAVLLADRIALLRAGRLQQYSTPEQMWREPANEFVRDFFGENLGLRIMARHCLSGVELGPLPESADAAEMARVPASATLKEALAELVGSRSERVLVVDGDRPLGTFSFDALVRALENGSEGADGTADAGAAAARAAGAGSDA